MADEWFDAYSFADLWEGDLVGVDCGGVPVLLVNLDGNVLAYDNRCPHQASPLHEGELDGETLVCARHLWCFDVSTGKGINPDNSTLIAYDAKVEGERILVRRPAAGPVEGSAASPVEGLTEGPAEGLTEGR